MAAAMQLIVEPVTLALKTPFHIAHGVSTARHNVWVHLGDAVGEAALAPYYMTTQADVAEYVKGLNADALIGKHPLALEDMLDRLQPGPPQARSAVDIMLHDYWGKRLGQPLYQLWGLNPARAPNSSITLSLPKNEAELRGRIQKLDGWPILKLKLGSGSLDTDEALVRAARDETKAQLCVDANSAWRVEEAARIIPRLAQYDVLFVEQPLARTSVADWRHLREYLPVGMPPLFADESVQQSDDILALAGAVDGVNIKLAKAGGLREARRMITLARMLGLRVMIGCMIESAVGVTAAAHLAPLADYADLDGNLDVANDPYAGVMLQHGRLELPQGPGLGVTRR